MVIGEEEREHRHIGTKFAGGTDVARGPGAPRHNYGRLPVGAFGQSGDGERARARAGAREQGGHIDQIRLLPGFEDFLKVVRDPSKLSSGHHIWPSHRCQSLTSSLILFRTIPFLSSYPRLSNQNTA
jgi:hypothetical protein